MEWLFVWVILAGLFSLIVYMLYTFIKPSRLVTKNPSDPFLKLSPIPCAFLFAFVVVFGLLLSTVLNSPRLFFYFMLIIFSMLPIGFFGISIASIWYGVDQMKKGYFSPKFFLAGILGLLLFFSAITSIFCKSGNTFCSASSIIEVLMNPITKLLKFFTPF